MTSRLIIVTGVNGIGKSTVIPELESRLKDSFFEIHDFDERGVPDNAGAEWRESETTHWFQLAKENETKGIKTVVCGFMKASDIDFAKEKEPEVEPAVHLLDADAETISARIMSRYTTPESLKELERTTGKTPEKFVQDNVWVSTKFREAAEERGYTIVDTSNLTPPEVAENLVANW